MLLQPLFDAINDRDIVSGLTHDLYRYPARFSPRFARAAIELFTKPGDTILDPFMGGSTSLVEGLALGRNSIGADINQLSVFLANVKTLLLSDTEIDRLGQWAECTVPALSPLKPVVRHTNWKEMGYQENLPWRFRKVTEQALDSTESTLEGDMLIAARCIVLKTVQWAVDCKKFLPTAGAVRQKIVDDTTVIMNGLREFRRRVEGLGANRPRVEVHHSAADAITQVDSELLRKRRPKLVITSPPYPGVHVLYHRWQVLGRKETPAPFWIANCQDGQGSAYYTFGDRRNQRREELYFGKLLSAFTEIRKVVRDDAVIVQLVGFGNPDEHLRLYLTTMEKAGFREYEKQGHRRSQYWRSVPNRKWYTWLRNETKQTSEVLLIHRPA